MDPGLRRGDDQGRDMTSEAKSVGVIALGIMGSAIAELSDVHGTVRRARREDRVVAI
jgi:hypothetical protein